MITGLQIEKSFFGDARYWTRSIKYLLRRPNSDGCGWLDDGEKAYCRW